MEKKIRRRRWVHKDGIPVLYDTCHPDGLTYAMIPSAPDCPIELRARIRVLVERLRLERRRARVTYHAILCYRTKLERIVAELERKQGAGGNRSSRIRYGAS